MSSHQDDAGGHQRPLNASFDGDPHGYDERRECHLNRRRARILADRLAEEPDGPVLEVGSGTGNLLITLALGAPHRRFVGVEPLGGYVEHSRERARQQQADRVEFCVGTAESLPPALRDEQFTWVLSNDTLHHVDDIRASAASLARVTRPGGRWLAIEPNRLNPYVYAYHRRTAGERNFDPRDFARLASLSGWEPSNRTFRFIYPTAVKSVPAWAVTVERALERVPVLAGGVALELRKAG